jgi:hypothetical protein
MNMKRMITLDQVPPDAKHLTKSCFYCYSPKQDHIRVRAVMAIETMIMHGWGENSSLYFGMCGNHAEVSHWTKDWQDSTNIRKV